MGSLLAEYIASIAGDALANTPASAMQFYASLDLVERSSPTIARSILDELLDQRNHVKLIASENFSSLSVQAAQGNLLTDKYAEGVAGHRFYAGCDNVDAIEREASELACQLFGAEHAYVQPHSGSDANLIAFLSVLQSKVQEPILEKLAVKIPDATPAQWNELRRTFFDQKLLAMDYYAGGHLTHGYRFNFSSMLFDASLYGVDRKTGLIDYAAVRKLAHEVKPLILLAGYSSYPRRIDFAKMKEIATEVGAVLMVDMAHFAGLVAGKVFTGDYEPVAHADIVTSTTHKTLRGPRGGIVLCRGPLKEIVDKACPLITGGPLPHAMAAKAVSFREALAPDFRGYAKRIVENSAALAEAFMRRGLEVLTGGSDNHMVIVDVRKTFGLSGRQAESALRECGITLNRNAIPFDENGPWYTSGLRVGTPAVTTLGMGPAEMDELGEIFDTVLRNMRPTTTSTGQPSLAKYVLDPTAKDAARSRVAALAGRHRLYPEIDTTIAERHFGPRAETR